MFRTNDLITTAVRVWSDRHVGGAIRVSVQDEFCYDSTQIALTVQNCARQSISGTALARCNGTQQVWTLIELCLRQEMLDLADQLEKVAAGIRSGL